MSSVTVIEVPQWRSSGSRTAERLVEGADLLAGMVAGGERIQVDERLRVDVADGSNPGELAVTAARVRSAWEGVDGFPVTVGGDCAVDLEPIAAAVREYGDRLVVVWFDAHGDLNTPESSPSGAFHGMVLRALTGEGHRELVPTVPVDPRRIVLAGARDLDVAEVEFIERAGVRHVSVGELADSEALLAAVSQAGGGDGAVAVYVHIDLDVLDPAEFASVGTPAAGGVRAGQLLGLVEAVAGRYEIAGLGIMEYEPHRVEDRGLLAPLVAALVQACAPASTL
ncbi:arginase family protein [Nonomuraea typhae]|uniref:arginase family protein n=1 Tax=Nonomuraea typhae TaxID=2603600 RepID=UPI0012F7D9CD|nr:arginase family protein [Nonomuraea typhae]